MGTEELRPLLHKTLAPLYLQDPNSCSVTDPRQTRHHPLPLALPAQLDKLRATSSSLGIVRCKARERA